MFVTSMILTPRQRRDGMREAGNTTEDITITLLLFFFNLFVSCNVSPDVILCG